MTKANEMFIRFQEGQSGEIEAYLVSGEYCIGAFGARRTVNRTVRATSAEVAIGTVHWDLEARGCERIRLQAEPV